MKNSACHCFQKIVISTMLFLLLSLSAQATTEYYAYFKVGVGTGQPIEGSSAFEVPPVKGNKPFEVLTFSLLGENATDISATTTGGGGAGKVRFERLNLIIQSDPGVMTQMFKNLALGGHFDEFVLSGYRSSGAGGSVEFIRVSLKLVVISLVEFEGTNGDEPVHSVILDYGAIKIESFKQATDGSIEKETDMVWSRVLNKAEFAVE